MLSWGSGARLNLLITIAPDISYSHLDLLRLHCSWSFQSIIFNKANPQRCGGLTFSLHEKQAPTGAVIWMAKDPAFLFYPGDYLRDTQCLNEKTQVAYDRIMCEHMRNICISQAQVDFFTKRLNDEERADLIHLLTKVDGGYRIEWVAESILKRKSYSESRRNNRSHKPKKHMKTYVQHMENEIENENVIESGSENEKEKAAPQIVLPFDTPQFRDAWAAWKQYRKEQKYPYKGTMAEQAALKKLSRYDERTAIAMIEQSIENTWRGLFDLKVQIQKKSERKFIDVGEIR